MIEATKLAWLAGMFDGEGSITMFQHVEKNGQRKICPTLTMTNTDSNMINECDKLFTAIGASFHIFERKQNNPKWKTAYQLSTRNREYIKVTLEAILPYLVGKTAQAEMVLRYVTRKIEQGQRPSYSSADFELANQVQALNKTGS